MRFQPIRCSFYCRYKETGGTVLDSVQKIKYLGITVTNDLKWNTHMSAIFAQRLIGFSAPSDVTQDVLESTYTGLVRPVLEQRCSVCSPQSTLPKDEFEKVQKRPARYLTDNYTYETGSTQRK